MEPITQWMGHRPGTPDSVPVIDRAAHVPNVYYAFGHGQTGLIGASTTGRLIAELVGGRKPVIDLAPYRASRFG
jgi:D-amino-acid dehydrogenase